MNFNKSANLALWLIFLVLVAPYFLNNNFIRKFSPIQNKANKELKQDKKSQEQNELISIEEKPQKNRFEFRNDLAIFTIERANDVCTEDFIKNAVAQNLENQKLLMKRMRNVVPNYIKFDWKPYTYKKMSEIIKKEDCIDKYKEIILPYGQELEVKSTSELIQREPEFYKKFYFIYSWDPDWPNCPEFGYPACKRISIEKWKAIAIEED